MGNLYARYLVIGVKEEVDKILASPCITCIVLLFRTQQLYKYNFMGTGGPLLYNICTMQPLEGYSKGSFYLLTR